MIKKIVLITLALVVISLSACSVQNDAQDSCNTESAKETLQNLGITVYDLIHANQMSTLLETYGTVRIEESFDETSSFDDYILYNQQIANIYTSYYQGEKISQTLNYGLYYVHVLDELRYASIYVEHVTGLSNVIGHESVLSQHFENAELTLIQADDTTLRLEVEPYENYSFEVIVDRETLAIQSIQFDQEGHSILKCSYQVPIESESILYDIDGPSKQVEIIADVYDEDYSVHLNKTMNVPANWEVVPACFDLHELYTDSSCSTTYSYPGDGIDYSVYLTNARG